MFEARLYANPGFEKNFYFYLFTINEGFFTRFKENKFNGN